ncbi:MAG: 16S rRNA (cytosine(1402)-N(4))-methyltransferase [Deltaproteobacteria bacterium]|nr:MAG: 16S rRNA (cytosine(1402)-N(4))-methyltransferase [Deltaproteobacteria bacterium]
MEPEQIHTPVLLEETIDFLHPVSGGLYVDGTMGMGGHSLAILERSAPSGRLLALDWDEAAIAQGRKRLSGYLGRHEIIRSNFAKLTDILAERETLQIDGLLIDLGLSSLHLDCGSRGFSFRKDEPLDMRMDTRRKRTAAELVNGCTEDELADIFYFYGEERQARPMAAAIVRERERQYIGSSLLLAEILFGAVPRKYHPDKIHVATRAFQALRIAVNGELENLAGILDHAAGVLRTGARFCVISFHSLEDRMVKIKFKENRKLKVLTPKPVTAGVMELANNPRARSAKLRVAEKI